MLTTAIVSASGSLAAAASRTIHLYDLAGHDSVKPRTFVMSERHGLSGLRWSHWGERTATGKGTMEINTCEPNCAEGRMRTLPGAQLQLSGVRVDQGHRYYRQYRIIDQSFTHAERNLFSRWTNAYVPSDFSVPAPG
ncbi:hypothetical protein ACFV2N_48095 [Streptomyces sp. NPDC059680]|uniref:hypothetical protein n=1 Tax=Streptomyces sp. NPDC059680 TaxID=3346904 RepID=UPI00369529E0